MNCFPFKIIIILITMKNKNEIKIVVYIIISIRGSIIIVSYSSTLTWSFFKLFSNEVIILHISYWGSERKKKRKAWKRQQNCS